MLWRFSNTVVMPNCTLEQASEIVTSPDHFFALQSLISHNLKILKQGDVSNQPQLSESKESILRMLAGKERPDLPWPSLPNHPEEFAPMTFEMTDIKSNLTKVIGSEFFYRDQHVILFHSMATAANIEQWKLRLTYEEEGKVKVSETVWGDVPAIVGVPLNALGIPTKIHKRHMDMYHTLLPAQAS